MSEHNRSDQGPVAFGLFRMQKASTMEPMLFDTLSRRLQCGTSMLLLAGLAVLSGCERYQASPQCGAFFQTGQVEGWALEDAGTAVEPKTGLRWYRCNGGERFVGGQCVGTPLALDFAEAQRYVAEVAAASGQKWRLPTSSEVDRLKQSRCTNPAINPQIFPSVQVENYWIRDKSSAGERYACVFYTYSGNQSCLQSAREPHPFWMVMDPR